MEIGHPITPQSAPNAPLNPGDLATLAGDNRRHPPILDIQPGDSAALIAIKIKAFTLNALLEILDATPLDSTARESLKKLVSDTVDAKRSKPAVAGEGLQTKTYFNEIANNSLKVGHKVEQSLVAMQGATTAVASGSTSNQLPINVQPHALSITTLNELGRAFDTSATLRLQNAITALIEKGASAITLAPFLPELAKLVDSNNTELLHSPNQSGQIKPRELVELLLNELLSKSSSSPSVHPKLTAPEWKIFLTLQDLNVEGLSENADVVLDSSKSLESRLARASSNREFSKELKEIFFSRTETRVHNSELQEVIKLQGHAANELSAKSSGPTASQLSALISSAASQVHANLSQLQMLSNNQNPALNAIISALAARLVVAYRLTPGAEVTALRRDQRRPSTRGEPSWFLRFAGDASIGSHDRSVIVSKDLDNKNRLSAHFVGENLESEEDAAALTDDARRITQRLGLNWLTWAVLK